MEIFEKKESKVKPPKPEKEKQECPECGNEFTSRSNKTYCSNSCRSKASMRRKFSTPNNMISNSNEGYMPLNGLNPQSQYIIKHQEKEIQRWEDKYRDEQKKREKVEADNQKLRDELAEIKLDKKLSENAKPSGLSGFMESTFMQQIAPHIAPVIGEIARNIVLPITTGNGMEGLNGIVQWLSGQSEEYQQQFFAMVQELSKIENPELALSTISKIKNFLTNGIAATTQQQSQQFSGSASAAY